MRFFWKNKFVFWNLVALIFVKAIFSYSGLQFASIMGGAPIFAKEEIVSQTNAFREFLGLSDLKENPVLDQAASQKLQNMITNQYFAHTSPTGISPWHWIEANNYGYTYAGENLAIGFMTAKDTVDAWENSPLHRANLANSNFKEIGVAVAPAKIQNSEGFLVVQLFGTPKPTKPAVAAIKPSPTPVPPKATPTSSPLASQKTTPTSSPLARSPAPSASVQSAAKNIVTETPVSVTVAALTPKLAKVSKTLNTTLIVYSLLAFLASLVFLVFTGARKELVIRTAVSLSMVVLAIAVPVFQISRAALIL